MTTNPVSTPPQAPALAAAPPVKEDKEDKKDGSEAALSLATRGSKSLLKLIGIEGEGALSPTAQKIATAARTALNQLVEVLELEAKIAEADEARARYERLGSK